MLKKIFRVFIRDVKSTRREPMAIYIIVAPILLAVAITLFTPGLNDTTVNLALLQSDEPAHIEYMQQYAKVELFDDLEALENRVNKRDDVAAIAPPKAETSMIRLLMPNIMASNAATAAPPELPRM